MRPVRPFVPIVVAVVVAALGSPSVAAAQEVSRWGVGVSFTPSWKADEELRAKLLNLEGEGTIEGKEVTVGFVRGSVAGGDWGVSYVQKQIDDGATLVQGEDECGGICTDILRDVYLRGVEFHWFLPLVTFAERVQLGVNVGGGVGFPEGTVDSTVVFTTPPIGPFPAQTFTDTMIYAANELLYAAIPLIKAEVQAAIRIAPGLKIKASGGLNAPSVAAFRIGAVYLIGGE